MSKTFKAILAIDSFKGSVSAIEACRAVEKGLQKAGADYGCPVEALSVPVSDGGEGLIECVKPMLLRQGYQEQCFEVITPYGKPHTAQVLINLEHKIALIESAEAIGLELTALELRNAMYASTYGLGQLIKQVVDLGCTTINIGLGGTATNDCGIGMAQALGAEFFDEQGRNLAYSEDGSWHALCGADLIKVAKIDTSRMQLNHIRFIGSCDVNNPLCGKEGATFVFGHQKGLSEQNAIQLEEGMVSFARVLSEHFKINLASIPGAGAAGGLGAALLYFFKEHVSLMPGIDMVLDLYQFDKLLQLAQVVIIGEGCMDGQTAHGKAPVGIAQRAYMAHVPCIALCGALKGELSKLYEQHITAMFAIANGPLTLEQSKEQASNLLTQSAENVFRCLLHSFQTAHV